jgi:ABC-type glycerol-3-phosphate transport system substrate-binding protein
MSERKRLSRRQFVKKGAILGLGAVGASGLLAACGDAPTNTAATNATTAATSATTAAGATTAATSATTAAGATTAASAGRAVEVTHWDWYVAASPALENEIKLFQQANPGITIKRTNNVKENYDNLFNLAEKGGNAPDVFAIPGQPSFAEQVASGRMADLTKFADWEAFKKTFPDPVQNFAEGTNTISGKTYSAPLGSTNDGMWIMLWVNTKVFKDAGIVDASGNAKLPQTAEDILAACEAIKTKSGGKVYGYGFAGKSDVWHWTTYLGSLSGNLDATGGAEGGFDTKTGKYVHATNPIFKNSINLLLQMRDKGYILPDSATIDDEAIRVPFVQGRFGMYLNGSWIVGSLRKIDPNFKDFAPVQVPLIGTSEPKSFFYTGPGGSGYAIHAKSKNADAAWRWFRWLHTPEVGERMLKSGNGTSIFPQANKPDLLDDPVQRQLLVLGPKFSRVGPQPVLRNPDVGKVQPKKINPELKQVVQGIYTGQITDLDQALKDLDAAKQKSLEQAIADAKTAGAKVSLEDYIFPDWDPTQNYVTNVKR